MKRSKVNKSKDRNYFRTTAAKTKVMNIAGNPMRGGIRL